MAKLPIFDEINQHPVFPGAYIITSNNLLEILSKSVSSREHNPVLWFLFYSKTNKKEYYGLCPHKHTLTVWHYSTNSVEHRYAIDYDKNLPNLGAIAALMKIKCPPIWKLWKTGKWFEDEN